MSDGSARRWRAADLLGIGDNFTGHTEKWVSALGGFCSIAAILAINLYTLSLSAAAVVVASMGASAVLLFAVPHSPLAQPWSVAGGHLVSAIIGITCLKLAGPGPMTAAIAVGAAIGAMHYLRCIHPPGGATALSAVVGGEAVQSLGYGFVVTPVLENVAIILLIALLFNYPFHWRRYPAALGRDPDALAAAQPRSESLSQHQIAEAIKLLDTTMDVSEHDLEMIYELARRTAMSSMGELDSLHIGASYSNGECGDGWQIRRIIDLPEPQAKPGSSTELVIYKIVAGDRLYQTGTATRREFLNWAAYPVEQQDERWQRVED